MMFAKAIALLSIALVVNPDYSGATKTRLLKASKGSKSHTKDCVKADEAIATAGIFADAVINISDDYHNTVGDEETKCIAAYKKALESLQTAYAYQGDTRKVLFKPTLTSAPYTFRNDKAAALSYFIGTKCLIAGANSPDVPQRWVFPPGNEDGSIFKENGFALGLTQDRNGWKAVTKDGPYDVLSGGENCETALLVGQICWSANNPDVAGTCVDKTFSIINNPDPDSPVYGNLPAIITSHHSSAVVTERTLTICQDAAGKGPEDLLYNNKPVCPN